MPIKILAYFLCVILLFSAMPVFARPQTQDDTEALARAVVHLLVTTSNGSREGSGVIVSPHGIIFTAAHVVTDASEIRVELFDGFDVPPRFSYYARIQYLSMYEDFDFAILEIVADDQQRTVDSANLNLPFVHAWSYTAVVPEPIQIIGYLESASGVPHVTNGIIGSTPRQPILIGETTPNRYIFYKTNAIAGIGDSGGLVVNSKNEFIGIPIYWEDDGGGYVVTILSIATICEIESDARTYQPPENEYVATPEILTPPSTNGLTQSQIDAVFGAGNWFCFPHTLNDIGARDFGRPFVVSYPIQHVEYWNVFYYEGQQVPGQGGATIALRNALPRSECPASQRAALTEWDRLRASSPTLSRAQINNILGQGNWQCPPTGSATSIMLIGTVSNLIIQYPFIGLDSNYVKYGVGDNISSVYNGTLWLLGALPREECP